MLLVSSVLYSSTRINISPFDALEGATSRSSRRPEVEFRVSCDVSEKLVVGAAEDELVERTVLLSVDPRLVTVVVFEVTT